MSNRVGGLRLACELLRHSHAGINADGALAAAWGYVFATGVRVELDNGECWQHIGYPHLIEPGTANFRLFKQYHDEGRAVFLAADLRALESAALTDPVARSAAEILLSLLGAQGSPVPDGLAALLAAPKQRRHGPNPANQMLRDAAILSAIQGLHDCGWPVYSRDGEGESAILLVSQALPIVGARKFLTYDGVRDVWERRTSLKRKQRAESKRRK